MRKFFCLLMAFSLTGCASFQKEPVKTTAIALVAMPVGVALAVPLELLKIVDEQNRLGPRPLNEQPMYGNQPKTTAMIQADKAFLAETEKRGYSHVQGSNMSVTLGWRYFRERHDIPTAMKRFNQAWLLDPGNGDAFHGFAVLLMARDRDARQAEQLFQRGITAPRQSPGIWLDYGRFLVMVKKPGEAVAPLRKALTFADMGPDAEALLTLALDQSGDHASACAEKSKVQDGAQTAIRDAARALACGT